jgi:hypothetical protein
MVYNGLLMIYIIIVDKDEAFDAASQLVGVSHDLQE